MVMHSSAVVIPDSSALAPHTRHGIEGGCSLCGQTIQSHFGHRDTWLGCLSNRVGDSAPMVLIVDRRKADRNRRIGDIPESRRRHTDGPATAIAADTGRNGHKPAKVVVSRAPQTAPKESWVKYVAKFGVRHEKVKAIESERDQEVYTILAHAKNGLSRLDLLKAMKATKRTGIVDGAVRRLRIRYRVIKSATV